MAIINYKMMGSTPKEEKLFKLKMNYSIQIKIAKMSQLQKIK